MVARIIVVCMLVFGFLAESNAQTETKNLFQQNWSRENDRMYSKNVVNSTVIGDAHLRLWLSPKNIVYFTVMTPCLMDKRLIQIVTWKEGEEWASVEACDGHHESRLTRTDLPKYLENELYPLPRIIEVVRKKPSKESKKIVM